MNSKVSYCGELVRKHDPDRFLLSMFAPAAVREDLWALFAFNYEIAKTREVVSETQLGLIRLQWWRERIAGIYDGEMTLGNEVLEALAGVIERYDLPQEHFDILLHAREFDLEGVLPGNVEGLVNYVDFTSTPLLKLALAVAGGDVQREPVQVVAVNAALVGVLRAVPFHARQRRCTLPEDLLQRAGQRLDHLYEFKPVEGLYEVIKTVLEQFVEGVSCENVLLRKQQKLAEIYMRQLKYCGYDVFHPKMAVVPAFKALRLIF
ncbi:MAG: squalene/phytoene synthase family protein [Rhodospirillales bacterium]|nr:squalene/phytoene synthase family protein [Alphaproteobacteria bacterium]MCB9981311.1 squalene/phytoene synthase family protein [Rhodospirillales bacterium]